MSKISAAAAEMMVQVRSGLIFGISESEGRYIPSTVRFSEEELYLLAIQRVTIHLFFLFPDF